MRELHVAGYNAENNSIILRDSTTKDEFSVPADDQLRAAARGDVPGMRQVKVEQSAIMRPSEIQELIRAGASTDDLADKAGMQRSRLENLARPILMERANMVRRAQESHPILADGPSDITLAMAVHTGLSGRGINYHDGTWDSWKTADGHWIIELRWEEGHADNTAHWRFQQDRSYAVTSPLDETGSELIDPDFVPRRPSNVTPISHLGEARLRNSQTSQEARQKLALAAQRDAAGLPDSSHPSSVRRRATGYAQSVTVRMDNLAAPTEQLSLDNIRQFAAHKAATDSAVEDTHTTVEEDLTPPLAKDIPPGESLAALRSTTTESEDSSQSSHKKSKHPTIPSWEDVLLGVRGQQK